MWETPAGAFSGMIETIQPDQSLSNIERYRTGGFGDACQGVMTGIGCQNGSFDAGSAYLRYHLIIGRMKPTVNDVFKQRGILMVRDTVSADNLG